MAGNFSKHNINHLCRLCATKVDSLLGINIFNNNRDICKKISTCLPVQVHHSDGLPKMICSNCNFKLDLCFEFHKKCKNTENLFKLIKENGVTENNIKNTKDLEQPTVHLTMNEEQLLVQNSQEILNQPNLTLTHNLNNDQPIIMDPHELENVTISPDVINSHEQQLELHPDELHHAPAISHLVQSELEMANSSLDVQNYVLLQNPDQHTIISNHFSQIDDKSANDSPQYLIYKKSAALIEFKDEKLLKTEDQTDEHSTKMFFSDDSSEENSDIERCVAQSLKIPEEDFILDPTVSENVKCNDQTTEPIEIKYIKHDDVLINKCHICQKEFANINALKSHNFYEHFTSSSEKHLQVSAIDSDMKPTQLKNNLEDIKKESSDDEVENQVSQNNTELNDEKQDVKTKKKPGEPKICSECGKSYKTNYKLTEHMRKHTGEQPFKCTMCTKAFRSKIGLAQHEATHRGQFDYSCTTCGKGFQCKSYLIVHQRVHSNLKPYPCDECGKNFKTKQSLMDHMNRHLGVKPFMCDICGRGFITKGLCKSHQKVHSGRDNRQYPCTLCGKLFVSKSYLATHKRIHTGEKPFMCEVCGKGFLTRVDLRIHSTMHTGEKSFVCEICGKAFARRDALRCHRRSHTGERPYRCDICGQTFTQFSPMAIHKRLHTGERPYSCEICMKSFVSRSTMMSHRKKHV